MRKQDNEGVTTVMTSWMAYDATQAHIEELHQETRRHRAAKAARHRASRPSAPSSSSRGFWTVRRVLGARS